jgi:MoaA/NifB/PqqE/SkfB family radical SAM enzyme
LANFRGKANLLRGLLGGDFAYSGPFFVNVDLTRRCNLQCVGCRFHSPLLNQPTDRGAMGTQDMPIELFERLCRELKTMDTKTITLTGEGEPFLHQFLSDILTTTKREGFQVILVTNGTLLNQRNIQHLIDSRLNTLRVSLLACTSLEYENNYPRTDPIYLTRVVEGLKLLTSMKNDQRSTFPLVELHHPINRTNVRAIDSMVDMAHKTGVNALSFSPWKTFRGKFSSWSLTGDDEQYLRGSLSRIRKSLDSLSVKHNITELIRRYDIGCEAWRKLPCYIAWSHARILVDGTVLACHRSDLPMGNLYDDSLRGIWNGPAYRAFRNWAGDLSGSAALHEDCDCGFCGFVINNLDIHRYLKWLLPFMRSADCRQKRSQG